MTLDQLKQNALTLNENDRCELAASLLDTLHPPIGESDDEEVDQREQEMDNGTVNPITHEELIQRVKANRNS
ncbi:MAG TPA: hypothetical protein EYQ50_05855 [Verrucomicrobiales bacterium]|jgi:hypothetical protein|nr:hypothetical protein [Verrucomicrobiales bacterium]